jgi:hypothetical protein
MARWQEHRVHHREAVVTLVEAGERRVEAIAPEGQLQDGAPSTSELTPGLEGPQILVR